MDDLTQRYYEAEMRYLREAGKEFAQAYPDRAAMLNLDKPGARDPYVERLFEGFAFLMGRLREKLDDDLPELTEGLVSLLWPHYLRTIPSLSVVELSTDHRQMKQSETLSDFQVLSRPVGERRTRCFYSATRDITLHPLALPDVSLQYEPDGRSVIRLRFECGPLVGDWSQIDLSRLPLYLNADSPVACALHRALTLVPSSSGCVCRGRIAGRLTHTFPRWALRMMTGSGQKVSQLSAVTSCCWSISPFARSLCS